MQQREIFAKITVLSFDEKPLELIQGRVTGGSINIDGNSSLRRTCNLTLVAEDLDINSYYWGFKNKFKLEIGLVNTIDNEHDKIIWFKQGIYIITNFTTSQNTNNFTISINGKDKMCLLNGEVGGSIPHTTDFGVEEYVDKTTKVITYTPVPVYKILRESVQNFGNEKAENIIINDLEDYGLRLLEYRGDEPLFLLREVTSDIFTNMVINPEQEVYIDATNAGTAISENIIYDNLNTLIDNDPTVIRLNSDPSAKKYTVAKIEFGSLPGYNITELVYAGDLIASPGQALTSVLDKIVKMLGEFEYFYDLDGRFIFQRKKTYINTTWNSLIKRDGEVYSNAAAISGSTVFNLTDSLLVSSFNNQPNLMNIRNDFSIWGKQTTKNGSDLNIHMRYAIDQKPEKYVSIDNIEYNVSEYDWRELIYQMALDYRAHYHEDDFLLDIKERNPEFITGKTGYEQYYTDLEGFWRQIYNPDIVKKSQADCSEYELEEKELYYEEDNIRKYWRKDVYQSPESLIFWFDFLDGGMENYSVRAIGDRSKVVNDNDVKVISYRDVPNVIFKTPEENVDVQTGYATVQIQNIMQSLFITSDKKKSCIDVLNNLLYQHSYCIETANITTLPIYNLEPNTRIYIKDDRSKVNGEYIVNKITVPLTHSGTMSISAQKAVDIII